MNKIKTPLLMVMGMLLCSACGYEGSGIQRQYQSDRKECREYAESTMGGVRGNGPFFPGAEGEHIDLVRKFAHCMKKRGWAVNDPPEES